jgi:hypothetical protein
MPLQLTFGAGGFFNFFSSLPFLPFISSKKNRIIIITIGILGLFLFCWDVPTQRIFSPARPVIGQFPVSARPAWP